ncbi:MAG: hypothetical protein IJY44_04005 [Bacteroidaceae bacterium]|nr:hypothetical protein [Bacteroidaceae bacterium]
MEGILYVVVIFIIYSIVYVVKAVSSKNADVKGTPYIEEAFPVIEVVKKELPSVEPQENVRTEAPKMVVKENKNAKKERSHSIVTAESKPQEAKSAEKRERLVSLRSKSAAKRAIIEAEILNRKY